MKYRTLTSDNLNDFNSELTVAISMGWVPHSAATVNSGTNRWFIILMKND